MSSVSGISSPRLVVLWRITERCNFDCQFCEFAVSRGRAAPEARRDFARTLVGLLADWSTENGRPVHISWIGGEPFLWPGLIEVSEFAKTLGLSLGITTNGSAFTGRSWQKRALAFDEVTISIDGGEEHHAAARRRSRLDSRRLIASLGKLATTLHDHGKRLRVATILTRSNIESFGLFAKELAASGVDEIAFNQLCGSPMDSFFVREAVEPGQFSRFRQGLAALRLELSAVGTMLVGGLKYQDRVESYVQGVAVPVVDCGPGNEFLFVDLHGVVAPCAYTPRDYGVELTLSGLGDAIDQIRAAKRARMARSCWDCPATHVFGKFGWE